MREVPPRLEVVPVLIEFIYLINRGRRVTEVGNRLFLGKESISAEDRLEKLVKGFFREVNNILVRGNVVIEG